MRAWGWSGLVLWLLGSATAAAQTPWPRPAWTPSTPSVLVPSQRLDRSGDAAGTAPDDATASGRRRYVVPVLLSLVVPGAGEIASGHWLRGLPLVAAEAATWVAYAHFDREGHTIRDQFEAFADAHWDTDRWYNNLNTYYNPDSPDYIQDAPHLWAPEPNTCNCSPPFIPYEDDPQEYYENAGKYKHFYPGWDDWETSQPKDDPAIHTTPNRERYVAMRIDSNNNFDIAGRMLGVAAITRVASVLQSIWLVRSAGREDGLRLEPVTFGGLGSGLRLSQRF